MSAKNILFVAAIDFGTTYSGYAFSAKNDFEKDPLNISANTAWNAGARSLLSHKAPTAILLNEDQSFNSFGYQAENNYTQLAENEDEDEQQYYFFHRFKMILHKNAKLRRDTPVKDESGKSLPARDVFTHAIRYLKDHLYSSIQDRIPGILPSDIRYVLTVPAIWDDAAKQFMREAATHSGIKDEQLLIALEPEAASIFCQHYVISEKAVGQMRVSQMGDIGNKYMVVDLGGGTADITVHEKWIDGSLKEVISATGDACGGINVDNEFQNMVVNIAGNDVIQKLKRESMDDYIDLFREFESKKRAIKSDKEGKTAISIPVSLNDLLKAKYKNGTEEALQRSRYAGTVTLSKQKKLLIPNDVFRDLFRQTINSIIDIITGILKDKKLENMKTILMVGGFSDCDLVQNAVCKAFENKRVVVPAEADLIVLKGAVLFGHVPQTISGRMSQRTYGIQSWPEFNPQKHPIKKKVVIDGVARCKDVFFTFVQIGEEVTPGYQKSQLFQILKPEEESLELTVYWSKKKNPEYVDDEGCYRLGVLPVPLGPGREGPIEIEETMTFGETELIVQAKEMGSKKVYAEKFDFMT